jgi:hypothetical protein
MSSVVFDGGFANTDSKQAHQDHQEEDSGKGRKE